MIYMAYTLFKQKISVNFVHINIFQTEDGVKCPLRQNLKGELQCQNKLISSERPFKILQNEIKIVKIHHAVLEIFNFKDQALDSFPRKND